MNKQRRKMLAEAIDKLESAVSLMEEAMELIEIAKDEEQDAFDNMPESLQETERGQMTQENVDTMEEVYYNIESYVSDINDAIESIQAL